MKLIYNISIIIVLSINIENSYSMDMNFNKYNNNNNINISNYCNKYKNNNNNLYYNHYNYNKFDNIQCNYPYQHFNNYNNINSSNNNINNRILFFSNNNEHNVLNNNQDSKLLNNNIISNNNLKDNDKNKTSYININQNNKYINANNINIEKLYNSSKTINNNIDHLINNSININNLFSNNKQDKKEKQLLNIKNLVSDNENKKENVEKLNFLTLDLDMDPCGYKFCYGKNVNQIKPYRCIYKYYNNNTKQYEIIRKSFSDFHDFIQNLAIITNNNFVVSGGNVFDVPLLSTEVKELGLQVSQTIGKKIFLNGVKINNINKLRINSGSDNIILQMNFDSIEHVHLHNTSIEIAYIPLLSIIVNTDNKNVNKICAKQGKYNIPLVHNKKCNESEYKESESHENEEYYENNDKETEEKFVIINDNDIISNNKYFLNILNINTKRHTILQSNLPFKINNTKYERDIKGYVLLNGKKINSSHVPKQYYRKFLVSNKRKCNKNLTISNNITITPYEKVQW